MTSAAAILGVPDINIRKIWVEPWQAEVFLRTPTAAEKGRFEASVTEENRDLKTLKLRLCVMTICDEGGGRLFTEDDVQKLGEKNSQAIEIVATEALSMIQISEIDLEEATKN